MPTLQDAAALPPRRVWPGVTVRVVHGARLSVAIAELEPGILVPEHQHENEQIGVVVEGSAIFNSEGEKRELHAGGMYRFLANVPHQVQVGPNGAVFVECFSPTRSDWDCLPPDTGAPLRWPHQS